MPPRRYARAGMASHAGNKGSIPLRGATFLALGVQGRPISASPPDGLRRGANVLFSKLSPVGKLASEGLGHDP